MTVSAVGRAWWRLAMAAMLPLALLLAGCSAGGHSGEGMADPSHSVSPTPNYTDVCAPVGADTSKRAVSPKGPPASGAIRGTSW